MSGRESDQVEERLSLRSQLSEIARLPAWIERLASRHGIPENVKYAMDLCLEEAVTNTILHGYGAGAEGSVTLRFIQPRQDFFVFLVEDDAHTFSPLDAPTPASDGNLRVGGKGIHFLRHFADELSHEETSTGNRLRIGFSAATSEL